ncbi:hypothetical protein AR457_10075 [Streptomyces agglomeratus]|uniref:hypothetical protein n=1 Tax=Streptomyces agglomeratus TaxID=285458 RepID=UPI000854AF13|nr:hypothetical protein [Streptomyces agglomeratus]OEJ41225.1 hypothetical protein BGK70_26580 [Streptomyces agglomeratus]OEJ44397.1 hypothetical protein AR457_10075 [Streptomyces agglomeratus]
MKFEYWLSIAAIVGTLLGTWLGAALTHWYKRKQDEQQARDALEAQADLFTSAVMAVRITGHANDRYWNGWGPVAKVTVLATAQLLPGLLAPGGTALSALGGRADRAAALIAYMDAFRSQAAVAVTIAMKEAISAAMPLARHTDAAVAEATDAVLEALKRNVDERTMTELLRSFRSTVRTSTSPASMWRRVSRGWPVSP